MANICKTKDDWASMIRRAIKESGLNTCELEQQTGISNPQISRFITGKRSLTIKTAEKIAKAVGLELRKRG